MADYRNLDVWHRAHALAVDVTRECDFLAGRTASIIRDQLVRAVLSIPANIAEGSAKKSDRDFARFVRISLGSSTEAENHLLVVRSLELMDMSICDGFAKQLEEVRRMLTGLEKRLSSDADTLPSRQRRPPRSL